MKQFALIVTLFFGIGLTQVQAQNDPACCSPEWCKIFCGEKASNASTASLKSCKPSDCKKVASTASKPSCGTKAVAASTKATCAPKAASTKVASCAPKAEATTVAACGPKSSSTKAVAKTVANTSETKKACCAWLPGCCSKEKAMKAAFESCKPAKEKADKKMALAVKEE